LCGSCHLCPREIGFCHFLPNCLLFCVICRPQLPGLVGELLALARDGDAGGDSAAGGSGDAHAAVEKAKQEAAERQAK